MSRVKEFITSTINELEDSSIPPVNIGISISGALHQRLVFLSSELEIKKTTLLNKLVSLAINDAYDMLNQSDEVVENE